MKISYYRAFGLTIASIIPLPELEASSLHKADIAITFGDIPKQLSHCTIKRNNWQANKEQFLLTLLTGKIGRFLIEGGNKITIEPHPDISLDELRLYVLGSAFGALLYQRKHVILHASTVTNGDGAVIICGASGAGKSTTANALIAKGWKILSDDQSVIDFTADTPHVLPAYPQAKLWDKAFALLNRKADSLQQISNRYQKFKVPLHEHFHADPLPIKAIFMINKRDIHRIETAELQGVEKIAALRRKSYRKNYVLGEQQALHLRQCANIANSCPIYSIYRPTSTNSLSDILSFISEKTSPTEERT